MEVVLELYFCHVGLIEVRSVQEHLYISFRLVASSSVTLVSTQGRLAAKGVLNLQN